MRGLIASALLTAALATPAMAQMADEVEVPMSVVDGRFVVTVVTEEGVEMDFALSTGNGTTVLTETGAAIIENHGAPSMGGIWISMDDPSVIPDSRLSADGSLMGMVGSNTLNEFDILVDAPGGRLVLKKAGPPVQWEGMSLSDPSPLRIYHGTVLSFDVELNGQGFGAMLDLGTQGLLINSGAQTKLSLEDEDSVSLGVGAVTLPGLPVSVSDLDVLGRFDPDNAGFVLVGAPMAYDCALSVSWIRREVRTCVR
jgi:hypothetical protein